MKKENARIRGKVDEDNVLAKLEPLTNLAGDVFNKLEPFLEQGGDACMKVWKLLLPYHPEEFLPVLCGLTLAFFGGKIGFFIFMHNFFEGFLCVFASMAARARYLVVCCFGCDDGVLFTF